MAHQAPQITPDETRGKFEDKMKELALKAREQDTERAAAADGFPYINLKGFPVSPEALQQISEEQARALKAVCFFYTGADFRVGAVDPAQSEIAEIVHQISERTHAQGALYMISQQSLEHALELYKRLPQYKPAAAGVALTEADLAKFGEEFRTFSELQGRLKDVSVTDTVSLLVASALRAQATDIHLEAEEAVLVARFRLDGALHKVAELPKADGPKIVSRIKLLAKLKINIVDRPQDGRFTITTGSDKIDVRISTIPSAFGESVVMRLLRSAVAGFQFEDLGVRGRAFEQLNREIERPNGMILTSGPTGSGKTTTLYAILNKLNDPETKIITLEDPVEYKLAGITQSQIDPAKGYTFAVGMRSILRQDPDVIMVGEIRDLETVEIAVQSALTGHLVLSTIHTNSAAGVIPRFLALGAKPFLLAPALNTVMAQRLVRKIHEECKEEVKLDEATLKRVNEILSTLPKDVGRPSLRSSGGSASEYRFFRGRGCPKCFDLGYKGRIGIYEVMTMSKELEEIILSGKVSEYTIQEIAVKGGMVTMVQDGLLKALDGITTVEEVFSVAE